MPSIKPTLYKRLYDVLNRCGPFSSDKELRATFTDSRICHWLDNLPQSDSIRGRIDQTISFLNEQFDTNYANGLGLFLYVLMDRVSPDDVCHRELVELAQEIGVNHSSAKVNRPDIKLNIGVEVGDIATYKADVVALKFAQALFGADWVITQALGKSEEDIIGLLPSRGYYKLFPSLGRISAKHALFINVPPLYEFGYGEIRQFSKDVLKALVVSAPQIQHLAMTIHGVGYGLDELEALRSQIAGYFDAFETGFYPNGLEQITIVENNPARAQRLKDALNAILPSGKVLLPSHGQAETSMSSSYASFLNTVGDVSNNKPYVFVMMSHFDDIEDVFFYGIQRPVNTAGYLCERADPIPDSPRALQRVMSRIESASFVVAELSISSPDVYLELGYALGKQKPILVVAQEELKLPLVVQAQKCITYKRIRDLEQALAKEIQGIDGILR